MVYEEKVPFTFGYLIALLFPATAVYMFIIAYLQVTRGPIGDKPAPTLFYILFGALFIGLTWFITQFLHLFIRIEEKTVIISYGIFKTLIQRDSIEKVYLDKANPLLSYGGWGLRFGAYQGKPRKVYNIPRFRCVVITRKDSKTEIVFSTANPDQVIQLLTPAQT